MQLSRIDTDADGHERAGHGSTAFPVQAYGNDMWLFPTHCVPWHWHEECELVLVTEGALALRAAETRLALQAGQAAFVNSNELHRMDPVGDGACRMDTVLIDPSIIGGAPYSVFQLKYVAPVYKNPGIRVVAFTGEEPWHADVLEALREVRPVYDRSFLRREMKIRSLLSEVWLGILENVATDAPLMQPATDPHIRTMMLFIHQHYSEPLTLRDIADSASVSERTCTRSFRKQLGMSAFGYLTSHRVKEAAQLLATTEDSITDICFATGFSDTTYFSRVFRSVTGQSPRAFRKDAARKPHKDPLGPSGRIPAT